MLRQPLDWASLKHNQTLTTWCTKPFFKFWTASPIIILPTVSDNYLTAGWGRRGCCHTVHPEQSLSGYTAGRSACWVVGSLLWCCYTWLCDHRAQKHAPCRRTPPHLPPRTPPLFHCCTPSLLSPVLARKGLQTGIRGDEMQFNSSLIYLLALPHGAF